MAAAIVATSGMWALTFLSLAYAGILFQQPNLSAVYVGPADIMPEGYSDL
jgi:hypothetical protein